MSATLQTNSEVFRLLFQRRLTQLSPAADKPTLVFEVASGLHAGTNVSVSGETLTIGGREDCAPTFLDETLADHAIELTVKQSVFGDMLQVSKVPEDLDVTLGETKVRGSATELLPAFLSMGPVSMIVSRDDSNVGQTNPFNHRLNQIARIAGGTLVVCAMLLAFKMLGDARSTAAYDVSTRVTETAAAMVPTGEAAIKRATTLQNMFREKQLDGHLSASAALDGTVLIEGILPSHMMPAWREVRTWNDTQTETVPLIAKVKAGGDLVALPALAWVRVSDPAEMVLLNGKRLSVGDKVIDGWFLKEITPDHISLGRGTESVLINY